MQLPYEEIRDVVLQPWEAKPHPLITWWDVLNFSAWNFFWCGAQLQTIERDCILGSIEISGFGGETRIFAVAKNLDDTARSKALASLKRVAVEFSTIGLRITAKTINELISQLENPTVGQNFQWLMEKVKDIGNLSKKEIEGKVFLYVPAERAKFFPRISNPHIFGEPVSDAFPSAVEDVTESGVCLALDRGSACVFHLMRVLEIGLTALGKVFGVSLAHTNWAPAIEQIESRVREMHKDADWKARSDCKDQQEFYAQAASQFGILKDAWRNYTMHARGFYTEEQAERIFENVKAFMQKLAERIRE